MADAANLEKVYDPRSVEPEVYRRWEESGAFASRPTGERDEKTFCIVIPPPNVTGALHLGHALNNTLQDILIRWHRMRGFNTLWQPGTDHAGIATQAVVERRIREREGKSRHELGATPQEAREELVRRIWAWKDEYEKRILSQLKLMGCSCDWDRNRFTLDEGLARAVRHIFFKLFKDGLIFRGKRLVNWDTQLQTAVADDEVYHETVKGHFWHFRYPVINPKPGEPDHVVIATTRPETMLADVAVAVNGDPEKWLDWWEGVQKDALATATAKERAEIQHRIDLIEARRQTHLPALNILAAMARDGRKVMLPLVNREIPLICDDWADPTLGSGCVKITPAHDANDYEVGVRHRLPMINVLTPDGKVAPIVEPDGSTNPASATYAGLEFSTEGRAKVVADLEALGLVERIEDRDTDIGHSDRSKTPIEPYLSDQWFVKTADVESGITLEGGAQAKGLAQAAIDEVESGRIQVFPSRYAKSYLDWLGEKRDWCISRQLWWGHRIHVWQFTLGISQRPGHQGNTRRNIDSHIERNQPQNPEGWPWSECVNQTFGDSTTGKHTWFHCPPPDREDIVQSLQDSNDQQDPDVLDTWFSSALWPFSTLGWPDETPHLKQYYPTSVLCTERGIITNWVARMVMFGLYAMGKKPFDHVYIHPKILDWRGETMSKSKGNGVDPVDIIHTHGADALRYTLADMTTQTQDIRMPVDYVCPHCGQLIEQGAALKIEEQHRKSRGEKLDRKLQPADVTRVTCTHKECGKAFATQWADAELKAELGIGRETSEKFEIGRNFCNKLWNAARFAFLNLEGVTCRCLTLDDLLPEDRWILAQLSATIRRAHTCIANYQFSALVKELREFFWDCLCDWYIELTKPRFVVQASLPATCHDTGPGPSSAAADTASAQTARQVLAFSLDQILRLFHPVIPFITERLWNQLNDVAPQRGLPGLADLAMSDLLITAELPPVGGYDALDDPHILEVFADLQDVVRAVRDLRAQCKVSPKDKVTAVVVLPEDRLAAFESHKHVVLRMANVASLSVTSNAKRPPNAGSVRVGRTHVYVLDISDDDAERQRTIKALDSLAGQIAGKEKKLGNEKFVANADPQVVEAERERLDELVRQRAALQEHLAELGD
ncbi:MAG: valine--tRNA ligase [Phycisphaerales bacterium]|nr:MAG: valine--tRNA ligase [Phycisphaerales bacterium]